MSAAEERYGWYKHGLPNEVYRSTRGLAMNTRTGRVLRAAALPCPRCGGGGVELTLPGESGPFYICGSKACLVVWYDSRGVRSEIAGFRSGDPDPTPDDVEPHYEDSPAV